MLVCYCANETCQVYGCQRVKNIPKPMGFGENYTLPHLPEKKPYKCPNCAGSGIRSLEPFDDLFKVGLPTSKKCHSCDGNGIIWSLS